MRRERAQRVELVGDEGARVGIDEQNGTAEGDAPELAGIGLAERFRLREIFLGSVKGDGLGCLSGERDGDEAQGEEE